MRLILVLLVVACIVCQQNTPFDDVTGNPTLTSNLQSSDTQSNNPQPNSSVTTPQSADMFALPNFGGSLNINPGSASLPLAPPAKINITDPTQVANYLQANITQNLRSDYTQFASIVSDTCCASISPAPVEIFKEGFNSTTTLSNVEYKQFKAVGAPNPGNYKIAGSTSPSLSPWTYQSCPNNKHLWVNGINTNWNPFYRRIYSLNRNVDNGPYRACFKIRNLPQCTWDAKPFGYINLKQGTLESNTFWYANIPTNVSCKWNQISSSKFTASAGVLNPTINLYNGETEDGNDMVIDDIRIIKLSPPAIQPAFNYEIINFNWSPYGLKLGSKQTPSGCKDNFYLRTVPNLFTLQSGNVTIKSTNEYNYTNLKIQTSYEIGVKRVCDCTEDSFWRLTFNLNFQLGSTASTSSVSSTTGQRSLPSVFSNSLLANVNSLSLQPSAVSVQAESNNAFDT